MKKVTTSLTFKERGEEAVNLYVSLFKNSKLKSITRYGDSGPCPKARY